MAVNRWTRGAGTDNYQTAGNWSLGAKPGAGDDVQILDGTAAITSVEASGSGVALASLKFGPGFGGSFGTESLPGYVDNVTGKIEIDAVKSTGIFLGVNNTKAVPTLIVRRNAGLAQIAIAGPGTWTRVVVRSGGYLRVLSGCIVTNLHTMPGATVSIESGATVNGVVYHNGGKIQSAAAIAAAIYLSGQGTLWDHVGTTTYNISGVVHCGPGSEFRFGSDGGTISGDFFVDGGLLQLNAGTGASRVLSNLIFNSGKVDKSGLGTTVSYTAYKDNAGDLPV